MRPFQTAGAPRALPSSWTEDRISGPSSVGRTTWKLPLVIGTYSFPSLSAGQYAMWAQAKGYDIARAEFSLVDGKRAERDLTLRPLADPEVVTRLVWQELKGEIENERTADSS